MISNLSSFLFSHVIDSEKYSSEDNFVIPFSSAIHRTVKISLSMFETRRAGKR